MQDVIGDWHDWVQLADKAEKLFGGVQDSALVAALRNITRAKFRQAVNTLTETRAALAGKKPVSLMCRPRALAASFHGIGRRLTGVILSEWLLRYAKQPRSRRTP